MRKAAAEVFGNPNKFNDYGVQAKMLKTMRLPRKETDLIKLVASTAITNRDSRSQQSLMSESKLYQSEPSLNINKSVSSVSRMAHPSSKDSKFSLASIQSLNRLQPRIVNLQKDLRDHRVETDNAARPA